MKIGLRSKFIVFFIIFTTTIAATLYWLSINIYKDNLIEQYAEKAESIANIVNTFVTATEIEDYASQVKVYNQRPYVDQKYKNILEEIEKIKIASQVSGISIIKPINNDRVMYIYKTKNTEEKEAFLGQVVSGYSKDKYKKARDCYTYLEVQIDPKMVDEAGNKVISLYKPIKYEAKQSKVTNSFIRVDINRENIDSIVRNALKKMLIIVVAIVFLCFLVLLSFVQISILTPINTLKNSVEQMLNYNFGVQTIIKGNDEISEISKVFNKMSLSTKEHLFEIEELNKSYYKFVPLKIFELIGKSNILEIGNGDQRNEKLTVCVIQSTNFVEAINKIPIEKSVNYITDLLKVIAPPITERGGVIERFEKAGMTALYTESVEEALLSAITACQLVSNADLGKIYNEYRYIDISVGIAYGPAMIGIVGIDERLSTTTISEYTTLANRIQEIAAKYKQKILISENAVSIIEDFKNKYNSRFVGLIYNRETEKSQKLYEVFDGDNETEKVLKQKTKKIFETAVNHFVKREFFEARKNFIEVLKIHRNDYISIEYLYLCDEYYQVEDFSNKNNWFEEI